MQACGCAGVLILARVPHPPCLCTLFTGQRDRERKRKRERERDIEIERERDI